MHRASPDFFATLQIPVKSGRTFVEQEQHSDADVVVVSENVATRFWPGQNAVGKRIKLGGLDSSAPWLSIIGVVGEVKYRGLPENPTRDPDLYFPFLDRNQQVSLVIRSAVDASSLVAPVRQVIREVNPSVPVFAITTMRDAVEDQTAQSRFTTWLMGAFAGVALLLASVGIYGVMSYLVVQRTHELGIRMALGATRQEIVRLVVGGGARLIAVGIAIGGAASLLLARVSASLLYAVTVRDSATFIAVGILAVVGLAACYVPAIRAARIDPLTALRVELTFIVRLLGLCRRFLCRFPLLVARIRAGIGCAPTLVPLQATPSRRASVGLTFEARQAGMNAAASAPAARTSAAAAMVAGSVAVTPNNWDWTSLPRAATQGSAMAMPAAIMATASRRTRRMAEAPVAPSARRMPISRVRRVTTNDITP